MIVNGIIPEEVGYVNKIISKKSLRDIIADVIKAVGFARACEFLDGIKNLGYRMAYLAGSSFNLDDIIIPKEKADLKLQKVMKKCVRLPTTITWDSSQTTSVTTR